MEVLRYLSSRPLISATLPSSSSVLAGENLLTRRFLSRGLLIFLAASLFLQLTFMLTGFYFKSTLPRQSVQPPASVSDANSSELSLDGEADIQIDAAETITTEEEPANAINIKTYTIKSGDTLTGIWTSFGASYESALKAAEAFKQADISLNILKVGTELQVQITPENNITALRMNYEDGRAILLDGSGDTGYSVKLVNPQVVEKERKISGVIKKSFSLTALKHKVPYAIVDQLVDLFGARLEFRKDVQPGDTFTIVYTERVLPDGKPVGVGTIKAASFENNGDFMVALAHGSSSGKPIYFDEAGQALGDFFLRYPLQFSRISSTFTTSRFHPVLKRARPHNGVDFAAPVGTPVRSVADGVISVAGYKGGGGNTVKIEHGSRYATAYLHLSKIDPSIKVGSRVSRGQLIGRVGQTGLATGPHLHFAFYDNGRYVDPLSVKLPQMPIDGQKIPKQYLNEMVVALKQAHLELRNALAQNRYDEKEAS